MNFKILSKKSKEMIFKIYWIWLITLRIENVDLNSRISNSINNVKKAKINNKKISKKKHAMVLLRLILKILLSNIKDKSLQELVLLT